MSVAERLRSFRYVTTTREIPWTHLRSIDVPSSRVSEPDLHLMKNVISLVSDCNIASATLPATSSADVYQLLSVLQLALQFTLWSQSILKEQLVEKQNGVTIQKVNSQLLESLEAMLDASRREALKFREERDTYEVACRSLEHRLTQCETMIRCLEKNLSIERKRLQDSHKNSSKVEMRHQGQQQQEQRQQENAEKLTPPRLAPSHNRRECLPYKGCDNDSRSLPAKHHKRHAHQCRSRNSDTSDSTSFSSHVAGTPRHGKNHRREDLAVLLRHLQQEDKNAEQVKQGQQQQQQLQSSPSLGEDFIAVVVERVADDVTSTFRREMDEVHSRMTSSCDAMRKSLENTVASNLQRTEVMIQHMEDSVKSFKSTLAKGQVEELQSVKNFLMQWQTDAKTALEASVVVMMDQMKAECAQQKKELEQERKNQHERQLLIPPLSAISPIPTVYDDAIKEAMCQHCHQSVPVKQLNAHEGECELRPVRCAECEHSVVARLLSKHVCASETCSESGSSVGAGLLRTSSLMLQESQRELQLLLKEEGAKDPLHETRV